MVLLKAMISVVDFALASVMMTFSRSANSKNEAVGWYTLIAIMVLDMIFLWI